MKTKSIFAVLIALTMSVCVLAQAPPENSPSSIKAKNVDLFSSSAYTGDVKISQAGKIAELVGVRLAILKKQKGFEGYRIRIFAKTGAGARTEADALRVEFREKHDQIKPYLLYNTPNWEIHVGNYRTRMEAMEVLDMIKEDYPQAFVTKTIIKFPDLEIQKETTE
ncbi:MAG: hypothetical protein U9N51_00155 [Bacteroidota bacterium]|nr:hypothetical protein [Bacteroidota bacterium]